MLRRSVRSPLAAALIVLVVAAPAAGQLLRIVYPDIEQGSATLVVSPTGQALLVDAGTGLSPTDDDVVLLLEDLVARGEVTSLDYVVATHYDEDHIGRLEDVLNFGGVSSTVVTYDRGDFGGTPNTFAFSDYLAAAETHGRTTISPFTTLDLGGGVTVECWAVNGDLRDGSNVDISGSGQFENSASVALVVRYGDFDAWIGGDLTGNPDVGVSDVEGPVSALVGDLDVYTLDHHGSRTSSSATFLSNIKAEVGINQSSVSNNFGHPNTEVVSRFLSTPDTNGQTPRFFQQNPGNPTDSRSDDSLADGIADPDDSTDPLGLPGTLTLLSDGTSYQFYGGAVGPVALSADAGPGTIGDYPPAVRSVSRTPRVPLASEAVSVTAEVSDEGAVTVELRWWLDGAEQAPIAMTAAGGGWEAMIPAQADGTQVDYRVEATDGLGQVGSGPTAGLYAGVTPIADLRPVDADGVMLTTGYEARVEGNLTVEPGVFHPFVSQIYVQDESGGLQIFDGTLLSLARGDRVRFVGEVQQFSGQAELNISEAFGNYGATLVSSGTPPDPLVVTTAQVNEDLEGQLVRINDVQVVSGSIPGSGNGVLVVSDDGGATTLTVFIDGDTDIPGAETPTQPFDLIGIAAQFDGRWPYTEGYEIIPRSRADFLSEEVDLPPLLINEIHADPDPAAGDANGDGVISSFDDEFVELVNTGFEPLEISGWTLADGIGVRHTFPAGTVVPAREAVVVFAGGTPTGDFGNAAANDLVFVADSGRLGLNNDGDTVTVADAGGAAVQAITYGAEGGSDQSLNRDPDVTNTPFVLHSQATGAGGSLYSPGTRVDGGAYTVAPGTILLSEVLYDVSGADDGLEWVELYNAGSDPVDLSAMSLGNGGTDYTYSQLQLSGTIQPGATFVVGGPTSSAENGSPVFDLVVNFSPDFQNSGSVADGVVLFNLPADRVTATTVPADAVVYGETNSNGLIDETGSANPPEVGDAPAGASIERFDLAGSWQIQSSPTPNTTPLGSGGDVTPPAPPTGLVATPGDGTVSLDWVDNDESDLDGYNVLRATSSGGPYDQLNGAPEATSAWLDSTVVNGTSYYYVITAVDTSGNESGTSDEVSATPQSSGGDGTFHVSSIALSTVGGGQKKGRAEVALVDDSGTPVKDAEVTGSFTGTFNETVTGSTNGDGVARLDTRGHERDPVSFSFCVDSASHPDLTYDPASNVESCDTLP